MNFHEIVSRRCTNYLATVGYILEEYWICIQEFFMNGDNNEVEMLVAMDVEFHKFILKSPAEGVRF